MVKEHHITPIRLAYETFAKNRNVTQSEILKFNYPGNPDVYNPSIPFTSDGIEVMACRVQEREGRDSKIVFFTEVDGKYEVVENAPVLPLEDPFVTIINGEIVLGGVHVEWSGRRAVAWKTKFYKGSSIFNLKYFVSGPEHMKDIRLLEMPDGKIAVCTRPQGKKMLEKYACIAKIGFTILDNLSSLTAEAIEAAPYIDDIFLPDEWGGVNQLYNLPGGNLGAIGHISHKTVEGSDGFLHYYGVAFEIDKDTRKPTPARVICSRDCFPESDSREPRLYDVVFSAGITPNDDGTAVMYAGLSDCKIGRICIPYPF